MTTQYTPPYAVRQLPVIGPWARKVGQVIDIMATPCNVDGIIAVQAAFIAIPRLVWSLTKPDPMDLVTNRWGGGHQKRRKRRFRYTDLTMPLNVPKPGEWGWATFKLGNLAERAGWYLLVVDATTEFVVLWTSTAYQMSGCEVPGLPYANAYIRGGVFLGPIEEWTTIQIWDDFTGDIMPQNPVWVEAQPQWRVAFGATMVVTPYELVPDPFPTPEFRLIEDAQQVVIPMNSTNPNGLGSKGAAQVFRDWDPLLTPKRYGVQVRCSGTGYFRLTDSYRWATGVKSPGILSDP